MLELAFNSYRENLRSYSLEENSESEHIASELNNNVQTFSIMSRAGSPSLNIFDPLSQILAKLEGLEQIQNSMRDQLLILNTENTKRANEIAILARSVNILETEDESESKEKKEPKSSNNIDKLEQSTNLDISDAASVSSKFRQVSRASILSPTQVTP